VVVYVLVGVGVGVRVTVLVEVGVLAGPEGQVGTGVASQFSTVVPHSVGERAVGGLVQAVSIFGQDVGWNAQAVAPGNT